MGFLGVIFFLSVGGFFLGDYGYFQEIGFRRGGVGWIFRIFREYDGGWISRGFLFEGGNFWGFYVGNLGYDRNFYLGEKCYREGQTKGN